MIVLSVISLFFSQDSIHGYLDEFRANHGMINYGYEYGKAGEKEIKKMDITYYDDDEDQNNNHTYVEEDDDKVSVSMSDDKNINTKKGNNDDRKKDEIKDILEQLAKDELLMRDNIAATTTAEGRKRMNVIILYPDDWRHNTIGKENHIIKTPFLDSLADEGIRFRQNAVTTSICWTSRATLFSGQWASRHQSPKLYCPNFCREKSWNASWPKLLQDDGYFTGHVGKWQYHSANYERFDYDDFFEGYHWYPQFDQPDISGEDKARDSAIRFLKVRPRDRPFAMTVAFYPPKAVGEETTPGGQWFPKNETKKLYENVTISEPYNMSHAFELLPSFLQGGSTAAVQRFQERFSSEVHYQAAMRNMYALVTQIDTASKQIVDEVKKQGLYNNTMIIFTTDNGMFHGSHGLAGKWYPYQESIRVPLIIYDPRMPKDKVGTVDDNFTLNVDLAETILGAAGLKPHERMQGRDISDLYLQNRNEGDEDGPTALERKPWRDEFFYEFDYVDDERYIPSSRAVVQKKWKYIDFYNHGHEQLFDLEEDPLEFTDVKDDVKNSAIVAEMREKLAKYVEDFTEPMEHHLPCARHNGTYWRAKNPTNN